MLSNFFLDQFNLLVLFYRLRNSAKKYWRCLWSCKGIYHKGRRRPISNRATECKIATFFLIISILGNHNVFYKVSYQSKTDIIGNRRISSKTWPWSWCHYRKTQALWLVRYSFIKVRCLSLCTIHIVNITFTLSC